MPTYNVNCIFTLQTLASSYCRSLIALFFESRISYKIKDDNNNKNIRMTNHTIPVLCTELGTSEKTTRDNSVFFLSQPHEYNHTVCITL